LLLAGPRLLVVLAVAPLVWACDQSVHCSLANCNGCCGANGCELGTTTDACGTQAGACVACGAGKSCVAGVCTAGGAGGGASGTTCTSCNTTADCPSAATCVQYAGSDFCGHNCAAQSDCASGESCLLTVADDGTQAHVCVPTNGTCGTSGCGACPTGMTCDPVAGACTATGSGGGTGGGSASSGTCGNYDLPDTSSCCHSCTAGASNCQTNGCYGGWWCDRTACRCHAASPSSCSGGTGGGAGGTGGGTGATGGGTGGTGGGAPTGTVGPNGGTVNRLYFAVVGDTRPSLEDDTANYPTAIITKIYQDIQALNPRPQFVVTTGDYQFANPYGAEGAKQIALYLSARNLYTGTVFAAMGNYECTGGSATDCSTKSTNNLTAFMNSLVTPLGQSNPWYTVRVNDVAGAWTSKIIVTACNEWNSTQQSWLQSQLATSTTYTFVVRHMPYGSNGPCNSQMDPMLMGATLDGLLAGHTHTVYFNTSYKELVEGVGGAPITGQANYGFATVEQNTGGGFTVKQYDYQTAQVVGTYTLP
jgi:hypothetical protein